MKLKIDINNFTLISSQVINFGLWPATRDNGKPKLQKASLVVHSERSLSLIRRHREEIKVMKKRKMSVCTRKCYLSLSIILYDIVLYMTLVSINGRPVH